MTRSFLDRICDLFHRGPTKVTRDHYQHISTTADFSTCRTEGYGSHAVTFGENSRSEALGADSIAAALGPNSMAKAGAGGVIVLAEYGEWAGLFVVRAFMVGEDGIVPGKWYRLKGGLPVEVKEEAK